jgi:hypothetical protein
LAQADADDEAEELEVEVEVEIKELSAGLRKLQTTMTFSGKIAELPHLSNPVMVTF